MSNSINEGEIKLLRESLLNYKVDMLTSDEVLESCSQEQVEEFVLICDNLDKKLEDLIYQINFSKFQDELFNSFPLMENNIDNIFEDSEDDYE